MAAIMLVAAWGTATPTSEAAGESATVVEYQVKAGFVFNFLKFVSWPDGAGRASPGLRIGILGDSAVFKTMSETLAGKGIGNHPVEVSLIDADTDVTDFRVIFVADGFIETAAGFMGRNTNRAILIVGETPGFARTHGMIGFVKRKDSLRLEINPTRARSAGLVISGKLASLADLVEDGL